MFNLFFKLNPNLSKGGSKGELSGEAGRRESGLKLLTARDFRVQHDSEKQFSAMMKKRKTENRKTKQ